MTQTNVKLRLSLQIQVDTPAGANSYRNRTSGAQHAAKMGLLSKLTNPSLLTFLGYWENLTAEVTHDYQDTVPTAEEFIQSHLDVANPTLKLAANLGFALHAGNALPSQPCTKLPTCGHDCYHQHPIEKPNGTPWIVDDGTGVKAHVIASLEWTSAEGMSMSAGGGG